MKIVLNKLVLKDLMESDFLIFRGTLFQSLVADIVKEGPPSVSRL